VHMYTGAENEHRTFVRAIVFVVRTPLIRTIFPTLMSFTFVSASIAGAIPTANPPFAFSVAP
jgi:hypothetical protein